MTAQFRPAAGFSCRALTPCAAAPPQNYLPFVALFGLCRDPSQIKIDAEIWPQGAATLPAAMEMIMDMRVSGSVSMKESQDGGVGNFRQRRQAANDLMSALSSGDLEAAQKAYAAFATAKGAIKPDSPLGQIGMALQSGDVTGAQQAAQSWQGVQRGHHHPQAAEVPAPSQIDASSSSASSGIGRLINVSA